MKRIQNVREELNRLKHRKKEEKEEEEEEEQYLHACLIPIVSKTDNDSAFLLRQDRLVDGPSGMQMRQ